MNLQAIMSALPWARRLWKVLPPQGRVLVLVLAAIGGFIYSRQGRTEADEAQGRAERAGTVA